MTRSAKVIMSALLATAFAVMLLACGCGKKGGEPTREPTTADYAKKAEALKASGVQKPWMTKKGQ
ncbi:MAG TPA: hypothetical protein PLD23_08235 [Armatimonadota bacterium]|nr:hypothetical protein [Armatimonadota bacterium]HQK93481.1 hypothetical protein [Armatimonadota bacterium]